MLEQRLTDIEIKVAHQDHVIEELHQVIYEQQKTIDKLQSTLTIISKRIQEALADGTDIRGHEKPPHY